MKTFTSIIKVIGFIAGVAILWGCVGYMFVVRDRQMATYQVEHNCRYDYNDLCYTEAERPWLFK